ncbi:hypothetical protein GOBAR_AA17293 [Gossypium barbadense]|uniref:Uncharacterized protein n=1 Tax=Gossypium barbadense TaxID=3634 RepID=A0A2P5XJ35_GOSBA|nr:hypothetical protein GOBAR_AA17293 [Gossypium barbadense]
MENTESEGSDEGDLVNRSTKKVRIRGTEEDRDIVMDTMSVTEKVLAWKDSLVGTGPQADERTTTLDRLDGEEDFELSEEDVESLLVNGTPSINFFELERIEEKYRFEYRRGIAESKHLWPLDASREEGQAKEVSGLEVLSLGRDESPFRIGQNQRQKVGEDSRYKTLKIRPALAYRTRLKNKGIGQGKLGDGSCLIKLARSTKDPSMLPILENMGNIEGSLVDRANLIRQGPKEAITRDLEKGDSNLARNGKKTGGMWPSCKSVDLEKKSQEISTIIDQLMSIGNMGE